MGVLDLFLFLFNSEVSVLTFVVHKKDLIYLLVCRLSVVFFKIATAFFIRYEAASVFVAWVGIEEVGWTVWTNELLGRTLPGYVCFLRTISVNCHRGVNYRSPATAGADFLHYDWLRGCSTETSLLPVIVCNIEDFAINFLGKNDCNIFNLFRPTTLSALTIHV